MAFEVIGPEMLHLEGSFATSIHVLVKADPDAALLFDPGGHACKDVRAVALSESVGRRTVRRLG